jgi:ribosomal protein S18 acetylase RimI-like enzyme
MAPSDTEQLVIVPLVERELPDAEALVREAGWNQTASDWRAFLNIGKVYAIRTGSGRVIATAAILPYGGQFAWISMVLVTREYQRRGLATQLLRRCIGDLQTAHLVPVLDATPAGREVYRGLGFVDTWSFQRYARDGHKPDAAKSEPNIESGLTLRQIADEEWNDLCVYDAKIFGADRGALLARLRGRRPRIDCVAEREGRIVGMVLGREGRVATQIGPLVADNEIIAESLLLRALRATDGPVFIDVPDEKSSLVKLLAAEGFVSQRPLTRMLLARASAYDDGQRTFAVVGPEFG